MSGGKLPLHTPTTQRSGSMPISPSAPVASPTLPPPPEVSSQVEEAAKRASFLEDGLRQYEAQLSIQAPSKALTDTIGDMREE